MSKFTSPLKLPTVPSSAPLKAEIMWGCESGGSPQFPTDLQTILTRRKSLDPAPMRAFSNAIVNALERVWIVDEYFLVSENKDAPEMRIRNILKWLPDWIVASDIRILTKHHDEVTQDMLRLFEARECAINAAQTRRGKQCNIQVCTRLKTKFNFMHDRFAIIDNELWHFGATVGGFHASVNAASRGWGAMDSGAIAFFELAWNKCKER